MPLSKLWGNHILSLVGEPDVANLAQRVSFGVPRLLGCGVKADTLNLNTNDFHLEYRDHRPIRDGRFVCEGADPTYYGDEICRVDGIRLECDLRSPREARAQEYGLFYDRQFDCGREQPNTQYKAKLNYSSPHTPDATRRARRLASA